MILLRRERGNEIVRLEFR